MNVINLEQAIQARVSKPGFDMAKAIEFVNTRKDEIIKALEEELAKSKRKPSADAQITAYRQALAELPAWAEANL